MQCDRYLFGRHYSKTTHIMKEVVLLLLRLVFYGMIPYPTTSTGSCLLASLEWLSSLWLSQVACLLNSVHFRFQPVSVIQPAAAMWLLRLLETSSCDCPIIVTHWHDDQCGLVLVLFVVVRPTTNASDTHQIPKKGILFEHNVENKCERKTPRRRRRKKNPVL